MLSFGFKYGLPPDADFVVDARFLPNPYWVPELREQSGRDEPVSRYVLGQRGATTLVETFARRVFEFVQSSGGNNEKQNADKDSLAPDVDTPYRHSGTEQPGDGTAATPAPPATQ